ncbi:DNA replication/repair protein RecF [Candidatus Peregrinibacteria bacterium]|nr:DNA replication/repair protein RecF [Candidatus Peregrinibacteria bacterium]
MHISSISLSHFRNISETTLNFSPKMNIFTGKNGQGKTNLLEAIYALSLSRPFRSREKSVFIQEEAEYSKITGEIILENTEKEILEIFWEQGTGKSGRTIFRKNGVQKSAGEFLKTKHFFTVLFAPEDMELPFASPKYRRQYFSRILSPLFPDFLSASLNFEKILKHRNKLLIDFPKGKVQKMEFAFWDAELEKWAKVLHTYRQKYAEFLQRNLQKKYRELFHKNDALDIFYLPSVPHDADFFETLEKNFHQDVHLGSTQKGPHRDDFQIIFHGKPIAEVGSRGEIRSTIIALKLCEQDFITEETSFSPVLLLDDVFSELDEDRRKVILHAFSNTQIFVTATEMPKMRRKMEVFEVKRGIFKKH